MSYRETLLLKRLKSTGYLLFILGFILPTTKIANDYLQPMDLENPIMFKSQSYFSECEALSRKFVPRKKDVDKIKVIFLPNEDHLKAV